MLQLCAPGVEFVYVLYYPSFYFTLLPQIINSKFHPHFCSDQDKVSLWDIGVALTPLLQHFSTAFEKLLNNGVWDFARSAAVNGLKGDLESKNGLEMSSLLTVPEIL